MKKSKLLVTSLPFLVATVLAGCGSTKTDLKTVFANLSEEFAVSGHFEATAVMVMTNPETGEEMVNESPMNASEFRSKWTSEYFNIVQEIPADDYRYDLRIDRDETGDSIIYELDPLTNTVSPRRYGGDVKVEYDTYFGNPFKNNESLFEVSDKKVVLSEKERFDFEMLAQVLVFGTTGGANKLEELEIGVKGNKPTTIHAKFVNDSMAAMMGLTQYYVYDGSFTNVSTFETTPLPTPIPAQDGQEALETVFGELRDLNFTVTSAIYEEDIKITDATLKVVPGHSYVTFENTNPDYDFMNLKDKGYFDSDEGLCTYRIKNGVATATNKPNPNNSFDRIFSTLWQFSGNVFNVNPDGTYSLPPVEFAYYPHDYISAESIYTGFLRIDKGSYNLALTDEGLTYSFTTDGMYKVEASVTNIGTTTMDVDPSEVAPYTPLTDILDWGVREMIPQIEFVINDITGNDSSLIPFFENEMSNDGFIDVGHQPDYPDFGAAVTLALECGTMMDQMDLYMKFMDQMQSIMVANTGYKYVMDDDEYVYGNEGDDVYFKVSFQPSEWMNPMNGCFFPLAVVLKVTNLNVPEGWTNPWDDMFL